MLTYVVYALAYMIDPFIWIHAFYTFLEHKHNKEIYYVLAFLGLYGLIVYKQYIVFCVSSNITIFFFAIMVLYIFIISKVLFRAQVKKTLGVFLFVYMLSVVVDGLAGGAFLMLGINSNRILSFNFFGAVATFMIRFFNLILYFGLKGFFFKRNQNFNYTIVLSGYVLIFCVVYIVLLLYFKDLNNSIGIMYLIFGVQLSLVIFSTAYAFMVIRERTLEVKHQKERANLMETKLNMMQYSQEILNELKILKHDMKHHSAYIRLLNEQNKGEELEEYLKEAFGKSLEESERICLCSNLVVSMVVSNKKKEAADKKIKFRASILADEIPVTDAELNAILSNLLDNAFEACSKIENIEERMVELKIARLENGCKIQIQCCNTMNEKEREISEKLITQKDKKNHGIGIKSIGRIVKKHGGQQAHWCDRNHFYYRIILEAGKR